MMDKPTLSVLHTCIMSYTALSSHTSVSTHVLAWPHYRTNHAGQAWVWMGVDEQTCIVGICIPSTRDLTSRDIQTTDTRHLFAAI